MRSKITVSILVLLAAVVAAHAQRSKLLIHITVPGDKAQVSERPVIQGTVSDTQARVWVIVHPLEVSDYWVQPGITVREDRTWKVIPHIGTPGSTDIGKSFEIMAVVNPTRTLKEGLVLKDWPEAQAQSQVIEVTRK